MLLLLFAMLGVFVARDLLLFYVFFELTLIPMFFIIGIWGGAERRYAAGKFFLFTFAGVRAHPRGRDLSRAHAGAAGMPIFDMDAVCHAMRRTRLAARDAATGSSWRCWPASR